MTSENSESGEHMNDSERMARDEHYPSEFEWGRLLFLLGGQDYEARTVENARAIVEWQRARIAALELAGTFVLTSQVMGEEKRLRALSELAALIEGPWTTYDDHPAPSIKSMREEHRALKGKHLPALKTDGTRS